MSDADFESHIRSFSTSEMWTIFPSLAVNSRGTRLAQERLREADGETAAYLAASIAGKVWKCLNNPHGNYVIQEIVRWVVPLPAFILDELKGSAYAAAAHKYACRVWNRLIENVPTWTLRPLIDELLQTPWSLCMHCYGKYVVETLLKSGPDFAKMTFVQRILNSDADAVFYSDSLSYIACVILTEVGVPFQAAVAAHLSTSGCFTKGGKQLSGDVFTKLSLPVLEERMSREPCQVST